MMSLRVLIQLAKVYQRLSPEAQAAVGTFQSHAPLSNLKPALREDREGLEKLEGWLQTAALEGVEDAGELAHDLRAFLYPSGPPRRTAPWLISNLFRNRATG